MSHFNTSDFPQPQLRSTIPNPSVFPQPKVCYTIPKIFNDSKQHAVQLVQTPASISPAKVPPIPPLTATPPAVASSTVVYYSIPDATLPVQKPAGISSAEIPPMPSLTATPPAPASSFRKSLLGNGIKWSLF